jgi:peroxiredoxin
MNRITTRWFAGIVAGVVAIAGVGLVAQDVAAQYSMQSSDKKAEIGQKAPEFTLENLKGEKWSLSDALDDNKIVVLEWFNAKCPFVVKHHEAMTTMKDLAKKYDDEVVWVRINSTNADHPNYGVDKAYAEKWGLEETSILMDAEGKVGKMYGAQRTPHMYIIDAEGMLRYNGAIDNHPKAGKPSSAEKSDVVNYVEQALEQIIAGETVTRPETRPYGCSIKYKS